MAEEEGGVRPAKRIARAHDTVRGAEGERRERHGFLKRGCFAAHGAGRAAGANRFARERELDEAATAERVPETAFPPRERRTGKRRGERRAFEPPRLNRAGAVALEPHATAGRSRGDRRETPPLVRASSRIRDHPTI